MLDLASTGFTKEDASHAALHRRDEGVPQLASAAALANLELHAVALRGACRELDEWNAVALPCLGIHLSAQVLALHTDAEALANLAGLDRVLGGN
ncbi:hypothetical protein D3C85_1749320 [compost metagenome]